jgi:hypothetical protein
MGCGNSKPEPAQPAQPGRVQGPGQNTASMPTGRPVMVPPTNRDASGRPITHQDFELDRDTIIRALDHMGQCLDQLGVDATVVTVGGAVNTVYLQSRRSTHDIDFFLATPTAAEHTVIHEATRSAAHSERSQRVGIGAKWFNNATQLLMGRDIQACLAQSALQQNVIVYQYRGPRGGIVAYAAPWAYAFCGKLNRLCESNARSYDIADAVSYLHQYLLANSRQTASAAEIKQWCRDFGKKVTDGVLDQVNARYNTTYRTRPISRP